MEVILTVDIDSLGDAGAIVKVKPGYARNDLLPRKLAVLATGSSIKELEHKKRVVAARHARNLEVLRELAGRLEAQDISIARRAGEEGKLFGSVTSIDVHRVLEEAGLDVERKRIQLAEPIKELGEHEVPVKLATEVIATLKVKVVAEEDD